MFRVIGEEVLPNHAINDISKGEHVSTKNDSIRAAGGYKQTEWKSSN